MDDEDPRPRGDLLVVAATIIRLCLSSERRALFAAMDELRERAMGSDLLNPLDDPDTTADDSDRGTASGRGSTPSCATGASPATAGTTSSIR